MLIQAYVSFSCCSWMASAALMRGSRGDAVVGAIAVVFIHDLDEVECRSYILFNVITPGLNFLNLFWYCLAFTESKADLRILPKALAHRGFGACPVHPSRSGQYDSAVRQSVGN